MVRSSRVADPGGGLEALIQVVRLLGDDDANLEKNFLVSEPGAEA